jgi:GT2 family glycosyltransferase
VNHIRVSFIICTYSIELFSDTLECINSLANQNYTDKDKEILLVMDKNDELYRKFLTSVPEVVNIIINTLPGLSEARNLGIKSASGDVIAFIDDDAVADKNYISSLLKNYEDETVVGVGGKILPKKKPSYPEELYWIGGFTYRGYPEERCEVRNVHGCNMSFRKEVFDRVGLFDTKLGRVGRKLVTAEETEFSIRVLNSFSDSKIIYDPSVVVYHKVHDYRQSFRYMVQRSYHEGVYKAHIEKLYNGKNGGRTLSTEDSYLKYLFTKAIPERIRNILIGKDIILHMKEAMLLLAVIAGVGAGYLIGRMK